MLHITNLSYFFLQEFEKQYLKQAFADRCRKGGHSATISSLQFDEIIKTLLAHKLSAYTAENVASVGNSYFVIHSISAITEKRATSFVYAVCSELKRQVLERATDGF